MAIAATETLATAEFGQQPKSPDTERAQLLPQPIPSAQGALKGEDQAARGLSGGRVSEPVKSQEIELATGAAQVVLKAETANMEATKKVSNKAKTALFVGGDVFTASYLGFQAISPYIQGIGHVAAVSPWISLSCGILGGAITGTVGIFDCIAGIETILKCKENHKKTGEWDKGELSTGVRLILCGIAEILVGILLIAIPIIAKFAAGSAIGVFLAANPWLLPLLFVIPTLLFVIELGPKFVNLCQGNTLAQKLNVRDLLSTLKNPKASQENKLEALRLWRENLRKEVTAQSRKNAREDAPKLKHRLLQKALKKAKILELEVQPSDKLRDFIAKATPANFDKVTQIPELLETILSKEDIISLQEANDIINKSVSLENTIADKEQIAAAQEALNTTLDDILKIRSRRNEGVKKGSKKLDELIELKNIMTTLESSMGPAAAVAAFKLYNCKVDLAELKSLTANVDSELKSEIKVQWIKITIQVIYLISFIISMGTIKVIPTSATGAITNAVVSSGLAGANTLPGYLDLRKPFRRNTPVVTAPLQLLDLLKALLKDAEAKVSSLEGLQDADAFKIAEALITSLTEQLLAFDEKSEVFDEKTDASKKTLTVAAQENLTALQVIKAGVDGLKPRLAALQANPPKAF